MVEYVYDALGRRIRKIDSKASTTNLYYYSTDWQVLEEADGSGTFQRLFVYGNYIDEVLVMIVAGGGDTYYYVHDHLFSPVALVDGNGDVAERYEYDAYGACRVHTDDGPDDTWLTGDDTIGNSSANGNPYLFTGRRLDILDSGSLTIQYNRNRCYDPQTGRWLTHDPLGTGPMVIHASDGPGFGLTRGGLVPNPSEKGSDLSQYRDGPNLYEYVKSIPVLWTDGLGLACGDCWPPPEGKINAYDVRVIGAKFSASRFAPSTYWGLKTATRVLTVVSVLQAVATLGGAQNWPAVLPDLGHAALDGVLTEIELKLLEDIGKEMGRIKGMFMYILLEYERCKPCKKLVCPWLNAGEKVTEKKWHACKSRSTAEFRYVSVEHAASALWECIREALKHPTKPTRIESLCDTIRHANEMLEDAGY